MSERIVFSQSSVTGEFPLSNAFVSHEAARTFSVAAGRQGVSGPPGPPGPPGGASYTHNQAVPAADWTISHGLARFPSVTVIDSAGSTVVGDVEYLSNNAVAVHFTAAFGGSAYLN